MIVSEKIISNMPNSPMGNSSIRGNQGKVLGQVSNSNSSLFNRLNSGNGKFGVISSKNVKVKGMNAPGKIPKLGQMHKYNVKNAVNHSQSSRIIMTTSNRNTSHNQHKFTHPQQSRKTPNFAENRRVFHSRPNSISKNKPFHISGNRSHIKNNQASQIRQPKTNSQIIKTNQIHSHVRPKTERILHSQNAFPNQPLHHNPSTISYSQKGTKTPKN